MKKSWIVAAIAITGLTLAFAMPSQAGQGKGKGNCERQGTCLQQGQGGCNQGGGGKGSCNNQQGKSQKKKQGRNGSCRN